jgi:hypothetical protein
MANEQIRGPLYSPITYDPQADPRRCYVDRGDVQCNFVTPNSDGFLFCTFKKDHSGSHHTAYVDTEMRNESGLVWMAAHPSRVIVGDARARDLSLVMRPAGLGVIVGRIISPFASEFKVKISVSDCPKFPAESVHHIECMWHAANEGYTVAILPARIER